MKKKAIIIIGALSFFLVSRSFAALDDNKDITINKANECLTAVTSGNSSKISQIENPFKKDMYLVCKKLPEGKSNEFVLSQVLLDLLFSQVDINIETYISSLSSRKGDANLIKEVSDKFDQYGIYAERYDNICSDELLRYIGIYAGEYPGMKIDTNNKTPFNNDRCINLYKKKLGAYENVANSKIQRNMMNGFTADKKTFMTKIKKSWEILLTTFDRYISKFGIIIDGTPKFTPKAQK